MHVLPHLLPHILVWGTLGIAVTVLLEATLSFLGIGVQPPTPSWGGIIFESQSYFRPRRGWCSSPASRSSCWRCRSTWSATGCATPSTRPSGARVMLRFLAGRVLQSLLILLGVTMITFGLLFSCRPTRCA